MAGLCYQEFRGRMRREGVWGAELGEEGRGGGSRNKERRRMILFLYDLLTLPLAGLPANDF